MAKCDKFATCFSQSIKFGSLEYLKNSCRILALWTDFPSPTSTAFFTPHSCVYSLSVSISRSVEGKCDGIVLSSALEKGNLCKNPSRGFWPKSLHYGGFLVLVFFPLPPKGGIFEVTPSELKIPPIGGFWGVFFLRQLAQLRIPPM